MDCRGDFESDFQIELSNCHLEHFDVVIGHIEDMLVQTKFTDIITCFMENHWKYFEDGEENKLIYMDIFLKYTTLIEQFIQRYLCCKIQEFSFNKFVQQLHEYGPRNLEGEVYEILYSLSDFLTFKENMLDYKHMKEGRVADLSCDIKVTKLL